MSVIFIFVFVVCCLLSVVCCFCCLLFRNFCGSAPNSIMPCTMLSRQKRESPPTTTTLGRKSPNEQPVATASTNVSMYTRQTTVRTWCTAASIMRTRRTATVAVTVTAVRASARVASSAATMTATALVSGSSMRLRRQPAGQRGGGR